MYERVYLSTSILVWSLTSRGSLSGHTRYNMFAYVTYDVAERFLQLRVLLTASFDFCRNRQYVSILFYQSVHLHFFIYNFSCTYIVYFDFCSQLTSSSRIPKIDLASAMGKSAIYSIQKRRERNELLVHDGSSSESSESDDTIVPPDGGWGWMVVLSSFMIHVIADGIVYSFGVFLMEFVVYFKSGRSAASLIGALQPAVTFTVGKW